MIPDYLSWRLTGIKANEYTNASTTGMLDAEKCTWDTEILSRFGIPQGIFLEPTTPGVVLGELTADISEKIGCSATVVLPATHDTGSAFLAVPAKDDNAVYVSTAHGVCWALRTSTPSPTSSPASRTLPTRADTSSATVSSRTSWACG